MHWFLLKYISLSFIKLFLQIPCISMDFLQTDYAEIKTSVQSGSAVPWHSRGVVHGSLMQSVMFNHYNQLSQNVTKSVYCRITIHLHSCPQLHIILKKGNDNSGTFRAIDTEKCMSHQMAKKCAGSGLLFMHLQLTFKRDGVHEFYDVLYEEINNKPTPCHQKQTCYC